MNRDEQRRGDTNRGEERSQTRHYTVKMRAHEYIRDHKYPR